MTETVVGAGAGPVLNAEAPSAAPSTGPSLLSSWLSAFRHGAATVYNDVVKAEQEVSNWRADHPEIGPLIDGAASYAETLLTAAGIPLPAIVSAGQGVMAALKEMAAADNSVASGH